MSIFPEKIVRTRGTSDGGFISEVYTLEAWGNLGCLGICILLFIFTTVLPAVSAILALLFCIDIDRSDRPHSLNIIGILLSIYLLIDIHNDWVISFLFNVVFSPNEMERVIHINHASILTNILVLIFSDLIFNLSGKNNFVSFLIISAILFASYQLSVFIF